MKRLCRLLLMVIFSVLIFTTVSEARFLDTCSGKWTTRDPIEEEGGLILYQFVRNNPVNFIDPLGLTCQYNQSSGYIMCYDDKTSKVYYFSAGYSGSTSGYGYNNPSMEGEKGTGPIPRGPWKATGDWYNSPNTGPNTKKLAPLAGNECFKTNRDCDSFRIHGGRSNHNSEGCIVLPADRTKIRKNEVIWVY